MQKCTISWHVIPTIFDEMMKSRDDKKIERVTKAFLKMKKLDIATLQNAYNGN